MAENVLTRDEFERDDFADRCLFTGVPVRKRKGEHVIPRWLISDYGMQDRKFEMGGPRHLAAMREFRAPAVVDANNKFGALENRVKLGQATRDELHLWQKKISVGMVLNHWRLSRNTHHPSAPYPPELRHLPFALKDFQSEFIVFTEGKYIRTGSTLVLPTKIPAGWMAHAFGATVVNYSDTHDAILPFGLVAISHRSELIISALHDSERGFESHRLDREWELTGLHECQSPLKVQSALAVCFSEFIVESIGDQLGEEQPLEPMLHLISYQFGIEIDRDRQMYRPRSR